MSCDEVREELVAWLDEELAVAPADDVRRHLGDCPACRAEEQALKATRARVDPALGDSAPFEPRFEDLWAEATTAESEAAPARRPSASRTAGRHGERRGRRSARRTAAGLAAAAAAAVLVYAVLPEESPTRVAIAPTTEVVVETPVASAEVPPELLDHPDMFVDFVIVRRLEKLRQLPRLVDDLDPEVSRS